MPRMRDKPCSRRKRCCQLKEKRFEYPGKQGNSSLWRKLSMSECQSNNFDEAGMFGCESKREWQLSSVIASFKDELIDFSDHASWQNPLCIVYKIGANTSIAIDITNILWVNCISRPKMPTTWSKWQIKPNSIFKGIIEYLLSHKNFIRP